MSGKPSIHRVTIQGGINFRRGVDLPIDYETGVKNKPKINGVELSGDMSAEDLHLQNQLVAGTNIDLVDNQDGTTTINAIGDGSSELSEDLVVSNPLGKYGMNDTIPEGTALESVFRGILSKTYYPALTAPSCSISYNVPALAKVGAQIASTAMQIAFNRGSISPKYTAESAYRSGDATNFNAILNGSTAVFNQNNASGNFTIPAFTRNSKGNVTLTATVSYLAGVQPKDSDGADYQTPLPAGTVSASKTIEFIIPFYWGIIGASAISTLEGLTEDLSKKGDKSYNYNGANNEYLYFVYDSAYGDLKSILDANNIENKDAFMKSTLEYEGQTYLVYRSNYAITGSPSFKFKF